MLLLINKGCRYRQKTLGTLDTNNVQSSPADLLRGPTGFARAPGKTPIFAGDPPARERTLGYRGVIDEQAKLAGRA